jgi:hypothetical protein
VTRARAGIAAFLPAAAVSCVFTIDLCNWIYRCGCRSLWAGATAHCNIHLEGVKHCPWCEIGNSGFALVGIAILGSQAAAAFLPVGWGWKWRLLGSLTAFPAAGLAVALAVGLAKGYWY